MASLADFAYSGQLQELPQAQVVGRVGRSVLLQAGKQRILLLQGSPYQIGYAHGQLLPEDVKKSIDTVLLVSQAADSKRRGDFFAGSLEDIYKRVGPYIPARYLEELAGLADGAGLDRRRVILANIFPEMFHCSGVALMNKATIILTDSGGIQEEAPSLGKPVLVMRETTERPEAVEAGTVKLVGTNVADIVDNATNLLTDKCLYSTMAQAINPYGDGRASNRILEFLTEHL